MVPLELVGVVIRLIGTFDYVKLCNIYARTETSTGSQPHSG